MENMLTMPEKLFLFTFLLYKYTKHSSKFSFSQLLKYHICTAGQLTSLGPSCSSGCAAAAGWGALPASEPQAWGSSPPLCRRT